MKSIGYASSHALSLARRSTETGRCVLREAAGALDAALEAHISGNDGTGSHTELLARIDGLRRVEAAPLSARRWRDLPRTLKISLRCLRLSLTNCHAGQRN